MKKCNKCNNIKSLDNFGIHKKTKDKLQTFCKKCINDIRREWKTNNPQGDKNIYLIKQDYYKQKSIDRYYDNKEEILTKQKEYYQNNKKRINEYYNQWKQNNKEKINIYSKQRKNNNPTIKISANLRSKISTGIKKFNGEKQKSILNVVGLKSWEEFRKYIENNWDSGMNWDNYGIGKNNTTWHIDHIIPLHSAKNINDILILNHYINLKPMWGSDNIRKGKNF
jgi:hypothetical protein